MRASTVSSALFTGVAALSASWGCSDDPTDTGGVTQQSEAAYGVPFATSGSIPSPSSGSVDSSGNSPPLAQAPAQSGGPSNPGVQEGTGAPPPLADGAPSAGGSSENAGNNTEESGAEDSSAQNSASADDGDSMASEGAAMTEPPGLPTGNASAGCVVGSSTPPSDLIANNFLSFPPGYDGTTPTPLVFGFHGAGRTNIEQRTIDSRTVDSSLEQNYVVAYMQAAGSGWNLGSDLPRLQQARQQILDQLCIDTSQVFAFGHSSGAQFITQMLGSSSEQFTGVVVVASSNYNNFPWDPIPTLSIHGLNDRSRGGDPDGTIDLVQYTTSNGCSADSEPVQVGACTSIASLPGEANRAVDAGCVQFVGCQQPMIFCNHDDINYVDNGNPTNHGWPCFANEEIFQFFEGLR